MVSFLKKTRWIVSKIGMRSSFDTASMFLLITFYPICLKTIFYIFPLFQSAEKRVFSNFLELGTFYGFGHQNHSEQVQK